MVGSSNQGCWSDSEQAFSCHVRRPSCPTGHSRRYVDFDGRLRQIITGLWLGYWLIAHRAPTSSRRTAARSQRCAQTRRHPSRRPRAAPRRAVWRTRPVFDSRPGGKAPGRASHRHRHRTKPKVGYIALLLLPSCQRRVRSLSSLLISQFFISDARYYFSVIFKRGFAFWTVVNNG